MLFLSNKVSHLAVTCLKPTWNSSRLSRKTSYKQLEEKLVKNKKRSTRKIKTQRHNKQLHTEEVAYIKEAAVHNVHVPACG